MLKTPQHSHSYKALSIPSKLEDVLQQCVENLSSELQAELVAGRNLASLIILTHHWIVPSDILLKTLIGMFYNSGTDYNSGQESSKKGIWSFLSMWYNDAEIGNPDIIQTMRHFEQVVIQENRLPSCSPFVRPKPRRESSSSTPSPSIAAKEVNLETPASLVAEQLALLDFDLYKHLSPHSLHKSIEGKGSSELLEMTLFVASIENWVLSTILSETQEKHRTELVVWFLNIAKWLRLLNSFNALTGLVCGLVHPAIARLSRTMAALGPDNISLLSALRSTCTDLEEYRLQFCKSLENILGSGYGTFVPSFFLLAEMLKQEKPLLASGAIDSRSLIALGDTLRINLQFQTYPFSIEADREVACGLHALLSRPRLTEEELFTLSYRCEPFVSSSASALLPRASLSTLLTASSIDVSISKPTGEGPDGVPPLLPDSTSFEEWSASFEPLALMASLQSAGFHVPDPTAKPSQASKQLDILTNEIFSKFARGSEVMTHEQYCVLLDAFPLFGDFEFVSGSDPVLTKQKFLSYMKEIQSYVSKRSFPHNFQRVTFTRPTFCDHCSGLIWGLLYQGLQCSACKFNSHAKCCKLVTAICRDRPKPSPPRTRHHSRTSLGVPQETPPQDVDEHKPSTHNNLQEHPSLPPLPLKSRLEELEELVDELRTDNQRLRSENDVLLANCGLVPNKLQRAGGMRALRGRSRSDLDSSRFPSVDDD